MYAESYLGEDGLARLMEDGKRIIEGLVTINNHEIPHMEVVE